MLLCAVGVLFYVKRKDCSAGDINVNIVSAFDEQLSVTELSGSDLNNWFREKNPNHDFINLAVILNDENLTKLGMSDVLFTYCKESIKRSENIVLQALISKEDSSVILVRTISFISMSEKLKNAFDNNKGRLILK